MMKKHILAVVAGLLLMPSLLWALPDGVSTLELGAKAPDFRLKGVDGEFHTLDDYSDAEVLAVVFTCNHCPTAQAYEDRIKELTADFRDEGVAVVAISPNDPDSLRLNELGYTDLSDTYAEMKIRARDHNFNFPYLYDGDKQQAARAYGATATPHVFIFGEARKLRYVGRIDDAENPEKVERRDARNAIKALLAGKEVPNPKTKNFGCSIKWAGKEEAVERHRRELAQEPVSVDMIGVSGIEKLIKNETDQLRLINFWATWCGPCVAEFPDLVEINRMYRHRDFELVTVSADKADKKEDVLDFLKDQEASNRNYLFEADDTYALIEAVNHDWPGALPFTLLVAPGGEVIYKHLGQMDPLEVKREIVGYIGRYYFSND